ncbi:MAG: TonB-dependent receptor [Prevotella sp.]|nr:TonB-dependent receptor [Prevotella sp.]
MRKYIIIAIMGLAMSPCVTMAQRDTISLQGVVVNGVAPGNNVASVVPRQQVDREKMVRLGIFNIEDALKHMAGITVKDYGGAGGMKTVSVRGIGAKHTAVVYDGVALTDCQTGEIDLSRYSLDNLKSLQLTIGDGDNIFIPARSVASAASLELTTDLGTAAGPAQALRVGTTVGSWGTVKPSVFYRTLLGSHVMMNVQGEYLYSENDYPFTLTNVELVTHERRKNSRMNSGHAETNLIWTPDNSTRVGAKLFYYDNSRHLPGIVHLYTQDNDERLHERNAFGQLNYLGLWSSRWSMKAAAKFNWNSSLYKVGVPSGGVKSESYWQREYYATMSWLYSPMSWWSWSYAADYALNNLNSTLTTSTGGVNSPISVGPYRHTVLQSLSTKVTAGHLTGTARLLWSNYFNGVRQGEASADAHRWSPSVSLSWQLTERPHLFVRMFWKNIFRVPTFNELYYYHIGTASLQPENTQQWNLGFTGNVERGAFGLRFTVDGYLSEVNNKIVAIPFNMFVWRMMNLGKVGVHGLDVTIDATQRLSATHQLQLTGNYSLQKAQNKTNKQSVNYGKQIAYTPEHSFSAALSWLNPWVNLTLSMDGMSHRWATNEHADETRIPGFAEMEVSAFRTLGWKHCRLTLRGGIQNILNKQYDIVAHYPMPGRSWKLSATLEL